MRKSAAICLMLVSVLFIGGTVSAADKDNFEVDWYGKFKLDAAYDQNLTSHGNFVMWVEPQSLDQDDEQYNMTANESRFGFKAMRSGYEGWDVGGQLEFDLYAGVGGGTVAENKAMLQLRHAYMTVERGNTKLLAGQSWDLVSPLNAATLNYPVLWGVGNIGYRRPQVSLWHTVQPSPNTDVTFATGFFRTIGSDLTPTFSLAAGETSEGSDDGTDAGIPTVQGLLDVKTTLSAGTKVRFGVSGLWGRLKAETNLGNSEKYESWGVNGHLQVDFSSSFGVLGEAYTGSNLGSYFGGILLSSQVDGLESVGGWGMAWYKPAPKVKLAAGVGIDNPDNNDLVSGRSKNTAYFGNIRYSFVPQVTVGLELSQWETEYIGADDASTFRVQTSFILNY